MPTVKEIPTDFWNYLISPPRLFIGQNEQVRVANRERLFPIMTDN